MATFSVDITSVVFAGARTGYKDITITGMPAGGVTVSLYGDSTYFTYTNNPESKGTNVYRVSTKSTYISSTGSKRTGIFKIINASDSTDYVNVSLTQIRNWGKDNVYSSSSSYSDIYTDGSGYFPYRLSDSTGHIEVLVDGYTKYTKEDSWISVVVETAYTDTGFKRILVSCTNNYDGPRKGVIYFGGGDGSGLGNPVYIYQNGYPSSTSGCTQSLSFLKSGGTQIIELKIPSTYDVSDISHRAYPIEYRDSLSISKITDTRLNYSVTVGNNNTGSDLRGIVIFDGGSGSSSTYLGHTIITQSAEGTPSPTLTVDPTSLTYPASGGAIVLDVTYSGTLTTSEFPSWLTYQTVNVDSTHRSYTITASKNSSTSIRSFNLELSDSTMSLTVPITQEAGEPAENISVSPSSLSFSADAGSEDITFRYGGDNYSVDAKEVYTWTTVSLSDVSTGLVTGTVSVSTNTSTSSRRGNIYFSSGSESVALPIEQEGISFALSAEPSSLNIPASGGSVTTAVTYTGTLSAASLPSWLSETHTDVDANHKTYTLTAASNKTTSSRTFNWRLDDSYNHCWVYFDQAAAENVSLNISPTSRTVSSSYGSVQITVTSSGISDIKYNISGNWITYGGKDGNIYTFIYESNTSTGQRTGTITFSGGGITKTYTLTQAGASVGSITATPSSLNFTKSGGQKSVVFTYTGVLHQRTSDAPDWVTKCEYSVDLPTTYYFTVAENKSEYSRMWNSYFYDDNSSLYVPIMQEGTVTPSLRIIPTSGTVDKNSGRIDLTVIATGIKSEDISCKISSNWLSYSSRSGYRFYFTYTENIMGYSRTATVTFSAYGETVTYTLRQAGDSIYVPGSLKVYPKKLRYYGEGGEIEVTFKNRPEGGIGYEIIYTDGSDWLSVRDSGPDKYVTATENSGIRRRASIKFYDVNDSKNYVVVPVIQGNIDGYDSIWMDNLYYPEDIDENGNYYYRIVDHNSNEELFRGISTIPPGWKGVGGINVPRLVEEYLHSIIIDDNLSDWKDMSDSYRTVDIYHTGNVAEATFKYCNDWSRFERRYDYTRSLNDPINGKGCEDMIIPFCVYYDDEATFSIVETYKNGNVNESTLSTPSTPFAMRIDSFYDTKKLEYKQDDEVIFSYDMNHCGYGSFIYRNRFGGWDSFLIEGNIIKTDNYTKLNYRTKGEYNRLNSFINDKYLVEKKTDSVNIDTTYQAYTGWLSDEEAERLVFHLLSSPTVYFKDHTKDDQLFNTDHYYDYNFVRITSSSAEYKKFRNGKKMVNYLITFEKCNIEKVRY